MCHVKNFVAIGWFNYEWEKKERFNIFEFWWKIIRQTCMSLARMYFSQFAAISCYMTYDCYVWSPYWTWAHSYFSSCVVLAVYCSLLIWSWLTIQQGSIQPTTHYTTNNMVHNQPPKWTVTPNCDLRCTEKGQWNKRKPGDDFFIVILLYDQYLYDHPICSKQG